MGSITLVLRGIAITTSELRRHIVYNIGHWTCWLHRPSTFDDLAVVDDDDAVRVGDR